MRRALILAAAASVALALAGTAAAAELPLRLVSQTATTVTLGWDARADAYGFRFFRNGAPVSSTFDGTRTTVTFAKADTYGVLELRAGDSGSYPAASPPPPEKTLTVTDRKWVCDGQVDYDLVKVTVSGSLPRTDAVQFATGCTGRIGRLEVDTANADGIHIGPNAHDLTVASGYVRSHGVCSACAGVHIDGIQALGGLRITMRLDVDYPTATNSALYLNCGSACQQRPTDVVCDRCTFKRSPDKNRVVRIGNSLRSGIRNSTVYWCGTGSTCDAPTAPAIWGNGLATMPVGVTYNPVPETCTGETDPDGNPCHSSFTGPTPDNTLIVVGG